MYIALPLSELFGSVRHRSGLLALGKRSCHVIIFELHHFFFFFWKLIANLCVYSHLSLQNELYSRVTGCIFRKFRIRYPSFPFVDGIRFIRDVSAFVLFTSVVTRTCTNVQKHLTPVQRALRNPKLPKRRRSMLTIPPAGNFLAGTSLTLLGLQGSRLILTHFWLTYNLLCLLRSTINCSGNLQIVARR